MAYFPNATAGDILEQQCADCPLGDGIEEESCPILLVQLLYNYDQCDNKKLAEAMNCLINEDGICQMRPLLGSGKRKQFCDGCGVSFGLVERRGDLCCECSEKMEQVK